MSDSGSMKKAPLEEEVRLVIMNSAAEEAAAAAAAGKEGDAPGGPHPAPRWYADRRVYIVAGVVGVVCLLVGVGFGSLIHKGGGGGGGGERSQSGSETPSPPPEYRLFSPITDATDHETHAKPELTEPTRPHPATANGPEPTIPSTEHPAAPTSTAGAVIAADVRSTSEGSPQTTGVVPARTPPPAEASTAPTTDGQGQIDIETDAALSEAAQTTSGKLPSSAIAAVTADHVTAAAAETNATSEAGESTSPADETVYYTRAPDGKEIALVTRTDVTSPTNRTRGEARAVTSSIPLTPRPVAREEEQTTFEAGGNPSTAPTIQSTYRPPARDQPPLTPLPITPLPRDETPSPPTAGAEPAPEAPGAEDLSPPHTPNPADRVTATPPAHLRR